MVSFCCGCLTQLLGCGANRRDLKLFDSEPLIDSSSTQTLSNPSLSSFHSSSLSSSCSSSLLADLLSRFLWHEITNKRDCIQQGQTHYLGSETDSFSCFLCHSSNHRMSVQFDISNRFFGNIWHGNQYFIQYVCEHCSKPLQKELVDAVKNVEQKIRYFYIMMLTRKLIQHKASLNVRETLISQILRFLPESFVCVRAISYHRPKSSHYKMKKINDSEDSSTLLIY